ncbi:hypothetical protein EVG20_g5129 [Dentipellis fragilis]|uniref:Uncharacterized protein n=1 Tax=Dentipellis fragilis TaxID=205917 RepID=A0A4Y9YTS7_9AGAM|nr:hypothetical protein EVG20_g5129 [Dentipellis fragilis]
MTLRLPSSNDMPPLQEQLGRIPIGSHTSEEMHSSCGVPYLASHMPQALSAITSSTPHASRRDVLLPYDVVLDLAAISSQMLPNGQALPDETCITPHSSPTIDYGQRTCTNMPTSSVSSLGPPPTFQHSSWPLSPPGEAITQMLTAQEAPEAPTTSTKPQDGLWKGKKHKAQTSALSSPIPDNQLIGDLRRTMSAQVSLKGRERERDLIALLRFTVLGERTTYTTRCNGIKQADVTHKKHRVLRAAIDKIDELQKRVDALDALVKDQRLDLESKEGIIFSLQMKLASLQRTY